MPWLPSVVCSVHSKKWVCWIVLCTRQDCQGPHGKSVHTTTINAFIMQNTLNELNVHTKLSGRRVLVDACLRF